MAFGTAIGGELHVAAGDLNADGRTDLVIGQPAPTLVDRNSGTSVPLPSRGSAWVILDAMAAGSSINTANADRSISGISTGDALGTIGGGQLADVNGDGVDDVLVGAEGVDGLGNVLRQNAGTVYLTAGYRETKLPGDDITILQNRNGSLVDLENGQLAINESFPLGPGGQSGGGTWFRFTTAGDGSPNDYLRLTTGVPWAFDPTAIGGIDGAGNVTEGGATLAEMIELGGAVDSVGILEFDLKGLSDLTNGTSRLQLQLPLASTANRARFIDAGDFQLAGEHLYFTAVDPVYGRSLFASESTSASVRRIAVPWPSDASDFISVGDTLYFTANQNTAASTKELWKSDGTAAGTEKIIDIALDADSFVASGNQLLFLAAGGTQLWETDGTPELTFTRPLSGDVNPQVGFESMSLVSSSSDVENQPVLFLSGFNPNYPGNPVLYASPGNNGNDGFGIRMVGDSAMGTRHRSPTNMMAFDGFLAFQAARWQWQPNRIAGHQWRDRVGAAERIQLLSATGASQQPDRTDGRTRRLRAHTGVVHSGWRLPTVG